MGANHFSHDYSADSYLKPSLIQNNSLKENNSLTFQLKLSQENIIDIIISQNTKNKFLQLLIRKRAKEQKYKYYKRIIGVQTCENFEVLDYILTREELNFKNIKLNKPILIQPILLPEFDFVNFRQIKLTDFKFIKCLGKGLTSTVYLVRNILTSQLFALKQIQKSLLIDKNLNLQILRERENLVKIDFPFIPKLISCFESELSLNFLLEYEPVSEMRELLIKNKKFNEYTAKFIFSQILLTIEYLHFKKIIYRDLRPDNILITLDGYIKLTDFGLSKTHLYDNTVTSSFCGNIDYMAPEMYNDLGHSYEADFYSMGALLYEITVGITPFASLRSKNSYKNENFLDFPEKISFPLKSLLKKLLNTNPKDRLHDFKLLKNHEFFKDIDWENILNKNIVSPLKSNSYICYSNSLNDKEINIKEKPFKENFKKFYFVDKTFENNIQNILKIVTNKNNGLSENKQNKEITPFMVEKELIKGKLYQKTEKNSEKINDKNKDKNNEKNTKNSENEKNEINSDLHKNIKETKNIEKKDNHFSDNNSENNKIESFEIKSIDTENEIKKTNSNSEDSLIEKIENIQNKFIFEKQNDPNSPKFCSIEKIENKSNHSFQKKDKNNINVKKFTLKDSNKIILITPRKSSSEIKNFNLTSNNNSKKTVIENIENHTSDRNFKNKEFSNYPTIKSFYEMKKKLKEKPQTYEESRKIKKNSEIKDLKRDEIISRSLERAQKNDNNIIYYKKNIFSTTSYHKNINEINNSLENIISDYQEEMLKTK